MKKSLIAGIIALGCITASNTDLNAQRNSTKSDRVHILDSKASQQDKTAKQEEMTNKLISALKLNKSQARSVAILNNNYAHEMQVLRESRMPRETKLKKMKALRLEQQNQIRATLTKQQAAKYDGLLNEMREERQEKKAQRNKQTNSKAKTERIRQEREKAAKRVDVLKKEKSQSSNKAKTVKKGNRTSEQGQATMAIRRTARISNALDLSKEQEIEVLALNKKAAAKMRTIHAEKANYSKEQRLGKIQEIERNTDASIRKVLISKEQKKKFDAYLEKVKAAKTNGKKAHKPMNPHRPY